MRSITFAALAAGLLTVSAQAQVTDPAAPPETTTMPEPATPPADTTMTPAPADPATTTPPADDMTAPPAGDETGKKKKSKPKH